MIEAEVERLTARGHDKKTVVMAGFDPATQDRSACIATQIFRASQKSAAKLGAAPLGGRVEPSHDDLFVFAR